MRKPSLLALLVLLTAPVLALAQERTPWKEPALGPIAATGATIDIENYHCTVEGPRSLTCLNVGRVCLENRARREIRDARRFGCALKTSPNYPCPADDPDNAQLLMENSICLPLRIGGF